MKKVQIFSVLLLLILFAGSNTLDAQRGMRGMMSDSLRMNRMRIHRDSLNGRFDRNFMPPMWQGPMWNGHGGWGMNHMWRNPWGRWQSPMWFGPMGRRMYPGMQYGMRRPGIRRGTGILENIPNLTDKQKAALNDLRQSNQAEMKKFREETAAKMKSLRDQHRQKMLDLLTPEQKKWFESHSPAPENPMR
jgi:hypothetical protein